MYGQNLYGVNAYATESIANSEEITKYLVDLNPYVPPYVYTKYEQDFQEVQTQYDAESLQLGLLNYQIEDLIKQAFIDSATWGLDLWEEEYGIDTNSLLSYEERREIIKAKKRGSGTTTKTMIKNTAESFSGGEVNIIEDNPNYSFIVQFVGIKGIPRNMQSFINMLEDIKPAHLGYVFKYTYTSWDYLDSKNLSWDNVESSTWDQLEIFE